MAIMVALMLVVMMAAVALAVDAGGLYLRRRELVNGADAAALSAARTCARGTGNDPRFATPEEAADYQAQGNAPILPQEVAGPNITSIVGCGQQYGHVSVQYTSQQALYFAPALGFDHQSPVTTAATASWGLGSNNPVPMVLSDLFKPGACSMPPNGKPSIGAVCAFWYDNDSLGGGNFTFLSLDAHGWDVTPTSSCNQAGGTNQLTDWITGADPASVTLNWTDPTYVCSDGGIKGVGNNPNSLLWSSVLGIKGQTRDFPINWEGPGAPVAGAVPQGSIFKTNGDLDKYDIIGFAAMTILDVVTPNQAQGSTGTCALTFTNAQTVAGPRLVHPRRQLLHERQVPARQVLVRIARGHRVHGEPGSQDDRDGDGDGHLHDVRLLRSAARQPQRRLHRAAVGGLDAHRRLPAEQGQHHRRSTL